MEGDEQELENLLSSMDRLSKKQTLDIFSCVECGRCTEACPANRGGGLLDPKNHFILDLRQPLLDKGNVVLGCSVDSPARHIKFIEKYDLPFSLISDESKVVLNAYGVWGPKKFMGREYNGIHRITFVIDKNRIIEDIITKVKTKAHTEQILK